MNSFVHLHVHSDFSLKDAAVSVRSLADKAEELGMTHLALTDHGNMFGIMDFIAACKNKDYDPEKNAKKYRVNPIIGCEFYTSPGSRHEKKGTENENNYYHLILLATNRMGYFNLVKLCSFAYTEGFYYRPRIDEELLLQYKGGIIALSACVSGEIPMLIRAGKTAEAEQKALHYRDLFGMDEQGNPNFYLEIQDHGIPAERLKGTLSQQDINREIIAISRKTGIPLAATNDVHYLNQEDYVAHDILLCIGTGKKRTDAPRKKYYGDQFYFKTADEMAQLFSACPEAIANTARIAERCVADVPEISEKELSRYLPEYKIPPDFDSADSYLRHMATEGLAKRYADEKQDGGFRWKEIQERCEYELGVIIQMGFTGYFLIVMDFINWAKEHNIPVGPGRGSGVGSVVAYSLRITDVEPLKYGLIFERFLNTERFSMPDFDIDFANEGRDDVMNYVTEKYGKERVGQIITFGTLGAKAVIKDVARTLDIKLDEAERIAKLIPSKPPKITLEDAFREEPRLREMESQYTELFTLARKLEGLNRQSGLHAAGVVIGKSVLHNFVPLFKDSKTGVIATQYDLTHLEKCGLVKMDFLGLKTLDVIKRTEELIRRRGGEHAHFSVQNVPEDDEATFKMLGEGQSFEVFQFESEGHRNNLRRTKPGKVEDLIALNALYRPGPMKFIEQFIDSKNGQQAIVYDDPILEEVLKETYGVIVYQEQAMQVARIIAGFSMGQADVLRWAMGKKKRKIIDKLREPFLEGAVQQGFSREKAGSIYKKLEDFGEYGFNKSHSAAYSVVAYHTAYLKANFPAEFMAANMTNEIRSSDDKLSECIGEARKMGIAIDPPDINRSEKLFTIVGGHIVYGLLGIKGVGDAPADEIVNCRSDSPYIDILDFLARVDVKLIGKSVIDKLIQTGAFDGFGMSRENLLGNLSRAMDYVQNQKDDKKFGQSSLFGDTDEKEYADFIFENFPEKSHLEKLKDEKQLIGFYFSGHPMDQYRPLWEKAVQADLSHPETIEPINQILIGIVKTIRIINSKTGKMASITIADYNGEIETIFFPNTWNNNQDRVREDEITIVRGRIDYQKNRERYSFIVESVIDIREAESAIAEEEATRRKREKFRNAWLYMADLKSGSLAQAVKGNYTVVGQLSDLREKQDRNGNDYAFGVLHDFEGDIDLIFFTKIWCENREFLSTGEFVALKGSIDPDNVRDRRLPSLAVSSIIDIAALSRSAERKIAAGEQPKVPATEKEPEAPVTHSVHIRLNSEAASQEESIYPLRDYISGNPGPCPVFIHIDKHTIRANDGISQDADLKGFTGVMEVWKE